MDKDPRIIQVEKESEQELTAQKGKYAFIGFGRSTDQVKKVGETEKSTSQYLSSVNQLIQAEIALKDAIARGVDSEGMKPYSDALSYAQKTYSDQKDKAQKRRTQLSKDILDVGTKWNQKRAYLNKTSRIGNPKRSYLLKPPKKATTSTPHRTQNLKTTNSRLSVPITGIINKERSKKLTTSRT